jgi:drug/metabolite transporter (DMT)-like permease
VVLLACLGLAFWRQGRVRALLLALGGGLLYGAGATIAKVATALFLSGGLPALLESWPLYAMAVLGPGGFLMTQHAYRSHRNLAPAQAVITLTDPLVGITLGILWLHETVQSDPAALAGQVIGLVILGCGVWLLAGHAAAGPGSTTENKPGTEAAST